MNLEDIEYLKCQEELGEQLLVNFTQVERVIGEWGVERVIGEWGVERKVMGRKCAEKANVKICWSPKKICEQGKENVDR